MNYTKGPWYCTSSIYGTICIEADHSGNPEIAIVKVIELKWKCGNTEDNASLISAAPEMYEAIKAYLEWGPMTGSDRDLHEAAFKAAIAKAEGWIKYIS